MIIGFEKYSSVKIGGEFGVEVLEQIRKFDGFLMSGANNLLVSPRPRNIGILNDNFNFIEILEQNKNSSYLRIGCRAKTSQMYRFSKENNLYGFEYLSKISGTLDGLLKMNAGLKDECISQNLVKTATSKGEILCESIDLSYRFRPLNMSFFWAEFRLGFGFDRVKDENLKNARNNQPSGVSFGSIFKNSKGDFAGRLIEAVGLKGFNRRDAMLSDKHANFLINKKNASSDDAIFLIELAKKKVSEELGTKLEEGVIII